MAEKLSRSAQRVQEALAAEGLTLEVVELPGSTRTSQEAAQAVGCMVGQIAKSLVLKKRETGAPLMVIARGDSRVDLKKVAALVGEPVKMADAEFVRAACGYAIGGVPPVGHLNPMEILVDRELMGFGDIWAAAGTPHAVFRLTPRDLAAITGGRVAEVS